MNSIIFTRPEFDLGTRYLSYWCEELISLARTKGKDVIDLRKRKASREEFESRVKKLNPTFVMINGHGSENCVAGQDNNILVEAGNNEEILFSRVTYAVSCRSAKLLGQLCSKEINTTYVGYKDDFIISMDGTSIGHPLKDNRARPFMEGSNQVVISLLKGHSAQDSSKRSKLVFENHYKRLLASNRDSNARFDAMNIWWDMMNQVCLGDTDRTI
ncbi:MAG: hypothetical protein UV57_C0017G0009 [Parcubacteria group bacterium GW2011_GWD2_43_10]|uniref:Uncharacterized protein n=2 Tax=Candidatus Vebleniibacteriota TaxID=1817921 RepID=A0A1G2Q1Z7_9BACT|nr:MAG: hypothetical protein UV57_C0017G0009 [Parcubacteria group bacterium GW2011_GWD2_43_10]OHA54597.1 MAG: hypothetical protein A2226_00310 [Candidatus Veblenbacteria bacterium RIFOXYA2_FULL_43_9]OHA57504.1 MAG: hypothetical protein A2441_03825 [Candidatus Veblenbacteria bacterium RIFOXYC2_FULL_42_11]HAO81123.1 hypothetical protein [Candidatus Veblenbacteria bacterium]HBT92069.1 hypothetical protein [Candidatus Veblenbacteria bacterium]